MTVIQYSTDIHDQINDDLKIVMIVVRKSLVELDLFAYLQLLPA
jgi:hypothetical protein